MTQLLSAADQPQSRVPHRTVWDAAAEPDVWWTPVSIDGAFPRSYERPAPENETEAGR